MNKFTVGVIVAIFACFGGLLAWTAMNSQKADYSEYSSGAIIQGTDDNGGIADHVRGKENSNVLVVEYADFQCPSCASLMPKVTALYKEYGDRVAFVYRNYPLDYHQNARAAAAAAEAAGFQGKYWEMMETIYSNKTEWEEASGEERANVFAKLFKQIAADGDEDKFREDMGSEDIKKKISFDQGLGKKSGVTATPSFFVNGEQVDFDEITENGDIKSLVEKKIKEALGE